MSVRVEWGKLVPDEVRALAEPMVQRWRHVVPTWCHELTVRWDETPNNDADTIATMEARPSYRDATLTIGPLWLRESDAGRDGTIRHELAHLCTQALDDVFVRLLKQIKKEHPAMYADFSEQWHQALEGTTCDIAAAFGAVP